MAFLTLQEWFFRSVLYSGTNDRKLDALSLVFSEGYSFKSRATLVIASV